MNVLSIQSHVAYGHVGNSSRFSPCSASESRSGRSITVQFSNHTGYGSWKGRVVDGPAIEELVDGIADRGVLQACDGLLSGYMGSADIGNAILSTLEAGALSQSGGALLLRPVIGDVGRGVSSGQASPNSCAITRCRRLTSSLRTSSNWNTCLASTTDTLAGSREPSRPCIISARRGARHLHRDARDACGHGRSDRRGGRAFLAGAHAASCR